MPSAQLSPANLFEPPPAALSNGEVCEPILARGDWHLERIASLGHASPGGFWYDQNHDEWVLLARGSALLEIENQRPLELRPGDHLVIPSNTRHRVAHVSNDAVWLALHLH